MLCSACRRARPDDELLAFWPVGDPHRRRYVCRPSLGLPGPMGGRGSCFAAVVGTARIHEIVLVVPELRFSVERPVVPGSQAWRSLLAEAFVKPELHALGTFRAERIEQLAVAS